MMNPTIPSLSAPAARFSLAFCRLDAPGFPVNPAPGLTTFATIMPRARQRVVMAKKYPSAMLPSLPTLRRSPSEAMPTTMEQKITGAATSRTN
jgi:hypothetical protein